MVNGFDIYLASASPRRRELLEQIGVRFRQIVADVDEKRDPTELPEDFVTRMALEKARAGARLRPPGDHHPVLGADTVVVVNNHVLGKPRNREQGLDMLAMLSGRTHTVMTAVALVSENEAVCCTASQVTFRKITAGERTAYWDSDEPEGKAGAYAIQGLGAVFVTALEGSYSGVMGLPLFETSALLRDAGINVLERPEQAN